MKHRIEKKESFQIIGRTVYMTFANEFWHDIGGMWEDWNSNGMTAKVEKKYSSDKPGHHLDVSLPAPSAEDPQRFAYTIGCVYNGAANEDGYDVATVPGGKYAVFNIPEKYADSVGDFMGEIIEYLKNEGHELAGVEVEYFSGSDDAWNDGWEAWILIKE